MISGLLLSCKPEIHETTDEVIARVGDSRLYLNEVFYQVPALLLEHDSLATLEKFRNNWIRRELLHQEAIRLGLDKNPTIESKIETFKKDILAQSLLDHMISQSGDIQVTRQEAIAYYETHKDQFKLNEPYIRFRHLSAANMQDAENARQDLLRGISWENVVERYAINKQDALRDATVFHPLSLSLQNAPPLDQFIRRMGINEISPIQRIGTRYQFVQLIERKSEGELPDLTWVLDQVEDWLLLDKKRRLISSYEQQIIRRAQANKEIHLPDINHTNE
ncbi:MAG: peptidyl-prolyl cis-trans isomerase [Rhodothermaceae bacterium]|nr:peptidyl-prolyl cis-trans isomerase [Rhodothermaceae bacterium]